MATSTQIANFIKEIAPHAQNAYRDLGKVLPSICIGMACVESGYGTATIMRKHNAFMGQKVGTGRTATKYWSGKFFTSRTKEEYTIGVHTTINAAFRAYDSTEQCIYNYYELLNTNLYKRVKANVPYAEQMAQIKLCGYMTSSKEVNSVINTIKRYNLTRYDIVDCYDEILVPTETKVYPTLRRGSRSEYVRSLQILLNLHGYQCGTADGIFGKKTDNAVRRWQSDHNLVADGIVGKLTWASLPI